MNFLKFFIIEINLCMNILAENHKNKSPYIKKLTQDA